VQASEKKNMWAFTHSLIPQKEEKAWELAARVPVIITRQAGGME